MTKDSIRDATEDEPPEATTAMSRHCDQPYVFLLCEVEDHVNWFAFTEEGLDR